jgi:hypothetical protein
MPRTANHNDTPSLSRDRVKQTSPLAHSKDPNEIPTAKLKDDDLKDVLEEEPGETAELKPIEPPITGPIKKDDDDGQGHNP